MKTKSRIILPILACILSLTIYSCGELSGGSAEETVISGQVTEQNNGSAIVGAIVKITSPASLKDETFSDSLGNYFFATEIDSVVKISMEASKAGFNPRVKQPFDIAPGIDETDINFQLVAEGDSDNGDGSKGDEGVGGESGGAASIVLTGLTTNTINVSETGGTVNTAFTFEVQDSAGRSLDLSKAIDVQFSIINGPGGGESITPQIIKTNAEGRATSNLFAGDSSGTVRVQALIERPEVNLTIRSTPVLITIASGFPVPQNFNVAPFAHNFDGFGLIDESHTNAITASVGDLKNNPVKKGTAVYFSTRYGGKIKGDAVTNENGFATTNLFANGSTPSSHPNGIGFIDLIAQTVDKDNNLVEDKTTMLLTTPEAIISISPTTFNIPNGGGESFDVTITDLNGYPMAKGTKFSVTGEGLTLSGDIVDLTFGDFFNPGPGRTEFIVNAADGDPDRTQTAGASITVTVTTPSGITTTQSVKGTRAKTR